MLGVMFVALIFLTSAQNVSASISKSDCESIGGECDLAGKCGSGDIKLDDCSGLAGACCATKEDVCLKAYKLKSTPPSAVAGLGEYVAKKAAESYTRYDCDTVLKKSTDSSIPTGTNASDTKILLTTPKLNVEIPGLVFGNYAQVKNKQIEIPFLAQYIAGVYRYLLTISVIAAAVMVVYGGFKYILAANFQDVQDGKETIKDALIGLVLVFAAYVIMSSFSPNALSLNAVKIPYVEPEPFAKEKLQAYAESGGEFVDLTAEDKKSMPSPYTTLTVPPEVSCKSKIITQDLRDAAMKTQQATGIPAAVILAQFGVESGFGKSCIGKEGKKFNCYGIKCKVDGKYEGREAPFGATSLECPSTCTASYTKEPNPAKSNALEFRWACFQDFNDFSDSLIGHSKAVKYNGWQDYNGTAEGFAHFVEHNHYAIPGYSKVLIQIMKDQCLL